MLRRARPGSHISVPVLRVPEADGQRAERASATSQGGVTIEGKSTTWAFPEEATQPVTFRSCDSGGAAYHFCPECGSTVYWDISVAPDVIGVAIGGLPTRRFRHL